MSQHEDRPTRLWLDDPQEAWSTWRIQTDVITRERQAVQLLTSPRVFGRPGKSLQREIFGFGAAAIPTQRRDLLVTALARAVGSLVEEFQEQTSAKIIERRLRKLEQQASRIPQLEARLEALEGIVKGVADGSAAEAQPALPPGDLPLKVAILARELAEDAFVAASWEADPPRRPGEEQILAVRYAGLSREEMRSVRSHLLNGIHQRLPESWFAGVIVRVTQSDEAPRR